MGNTSTKQKKKEKEADDTSAPQSPTNQSSPLAKTSPSNDDQIKIAKMLSAAPANSVAPTKPAFTLRDLVPMQTLGTGSYGRVKLVKHADTGEYFALKAMKKSHIIKMKQIPHVHNERRILKSLKHPFLINLQGTFQDDDNIYLLMDFVQGGELFAYLRKAGRFSNEVAKFYAAQLVLVFEHLQSFRIAHRDLKPENLLLDSEGYLRLTDFGFAKMISERTYTVCGTPEYLSPEIILSKGHSCGTDWWSLGVLLYELLVGKTPFYAHSQFHIFEKILLGHVKYPFYLHPDAVNLISGLLTADRTRRLGMLKDGAADIKNHPWFSGVDWDALLRKEILAPIVVHLEGPGDTQNFQKFPTSVHIPQARGMILTTEQQDHFAGF